jgi:hypothetical protein
VLRLHTGTSAYGVKNYFKQSDYYASEAVGRWGGKLAAELGLSGTVDDQSFGRMADNINPATGKRLTLRNKENCRIGEDIIWSLLKDVGAGIMLKPPEERDALPAMVGRRVDQMMGIIEVDVQTRVRRADARTQQHPYSVFLQSPFTSCNSGRQTRSCLVSGGSASRAARHFRRSACHTKARSPGPAPLRWPARAGPRPARSGSRSRASKHSDGVVPNILGADSEKRPLATRMIAPNRKLRRTESGCLAGG